MVFSLALAFLVLLAQTSTVHASSISAGALDLAAKAAGKQYFGTATDILELDDANYVNILKYSSIFGQITPENSMKWDTTEPEQNVFDFTKGDQIMSFAKEHGKIVRGHNLIWYNQLPGWVSYGDWTAETLTSVIQNHINAEVSHYAGQLYSWDVINEPFNDDGSLRSNVFYNILKKSYISIALKAAHTADPNAKLYINDYNLEYDGSKIDAMVQLVEDLLAEGTPIHGIGFECHYILGQVSTSELQANMERLIALGLEVAITELDIRMPLPSTKTHLEQQKSDYAAVVDACILVSGCAGVTVWEFTDKYSWVPSVFSGYGAACPWDANFVHKPAFEGIYSAFIEYIK